MAALLESLSRRRTTFVLLLRRHYMGSASFVSTLSIDHTFVASSTLVSIEAHLTSSVEDISPTVILRHSLPANMGFTCLWDWGGLLKSSCTAICVTEGCRCLGEAGELRNSSAKLRLWRCDLFEMPGLLEVEGVRCSVGGTDFELADVEEVVLFRLAELVFRASRKSLGTRPAGSDAGAPSLD